MIVAGAIVSVASVSVVIVSGKQPYDSEAEEEFRLQVGGDPAPMQ
jgi:hypothetical protein